MKKDQIKQIYSKRFSEEELNQKNKIWKILCENYFQKFIHQDDTILDIAAGHGEFINNIKAKRKIAVDINKEISKYFNPDVEVIISNAKRIKEIKDNTIDKIFLSNFLEHLDNTSEVLVVLQECFRMLKKGGLIIILQPNIYYVKEKYWFLIDHKTPLTHESLKEALNVTGFEIKLLKKKFLPYTTKSKIPKHSFFVKIYLKSNLLQNIFGKQIFVIAKK